MTKLYAKIKGARAISLFDFPKTWQVWMPCLDLVVQGPTELAISTGGGCLDIFFSCLSLLSSFSLSLGDGPI